MNNFQRVGAVSNTHAGQEFEKAAALYFESTDIALHPSSKIPIGYHIKKQKVFDLGSEEPPIIVECKSYTWTSGGNSPSAKIRSLDEVMLLFSVAPEKYRKILFILKHMRGEMSLGRHYVATQGHLVGPGIEIWEFDLASRTGEQVL